MFTFSKQLAGRFTEWRNKHQELTTYQLIGKAMSVRYTYHIESLVDNVYRHCIVIVKNQSGSFQIVDMVGLTKAYISISTRDLAHLETVVCSMEFLRALEATDYKACNQIISDPEFEYLFIEENCSVEIMELLPTHEKWILQLFPKVPVQKKAISYAKA